MKTFVIGDIHGAHRALVQCLERANFDRTHDRLIVLGDVCDGWPDVKAAIDELLKIPNLEYLMGNHDLWAYEWATTGFQEEIWLSQGGENTVRSYNGQPMPPEHVEFLRKAKWWHSENNRLFVHAGIDPELTIDEQDSQTLVWDRRLVTLAQRMAITRPDFQFSNFSEIFVGHTTTQVFRLNEPSRFCNVWMVDTGAGWSGRLSIMNVDTKEFWQSDLTTELFAGVKGRTA